MPAPSTIFCKTTALLYMASGNFEIQPSAGSLKATFRLFNRSTLYKYFGKSVDLFSSPRIVQRLRRHSTPNHIFLPFKKRRERHAIGLDWRCGRHANWVKRRDAKDTPPKKVIHRLSTCGRFAEANTRPLPDKAPPLPAHHSKRRERLWNANEHRSSDKAFAI